MKKYLPLCLLFLSLNEITSAQTIGSRIVWSSYSLIYSGLNLTTDSTNYAYTPNHGGDLTHTIKYSRLEMDLSNSARILELQTYNSHDNVDSNTYQMWNAIDSSWVNNFLTTYNYDAHNNTIARLIQTWDTATSLWQNTQYDTTTYDINNNLASNVTQLWDTATGSWKNSVALYHTYNGNNTLSTTLGQNWDTIANAWVNNYRDTMAYDTNNNDTLTLSFKWNASLLAWRNSGKVNNSYNGNNFNTYSLTQVWDTLSNSWTNQSNLQIEYDSNNNDTFQITQLWNAGWFNSFKDEFTYNSYNQILSTNDVAWDTASHAWNTFYNIYHYRYEDYTISGIGQLPVNTFQLALAPNPATDMVNINSSAYGQHVELNVYDLSGRVMYSGKLLSPVTPLKTTGWQKGVYLVQAGDKEKQVVRKLVIE